LTSSPELVCELCNFDVAAKTVSWSSVSANNE
jgi:hypothetical protein